MQEGSSIADTIKTLQTDYKSTIADFEKDLEDRNKKFVESLIQSKSDVVFVVGGLHAKGLVKLLGEKNVNCTVVQPIGYHDDEEKLLSELEAGIK